MDMAREELGLVWMGDMLLQSDPMMLDHQADAPYFTEPQPPLDRSNLCLEQPYQHEIDGFMMLGEFEDPYCNDVSDPSKFNMTTSATQTAVEPRSRKIKPIKHPGLKLQTPIAYQRDTDPSVIPIQRDGMAVCEKCGAIGVKHAFYTKERKFCSMQCVRGASEMDTNWNENNQAQDEKPSWENLYGYQPQPPSLTPAPPIKMELDYEKIPPIPPLPPALPAEDPHFPPDKSRIPELQGTFDWTSQLNDKCFMAAPVSCFRHSPMADCWDNITTGMKVEVENFDCDNFSEDFPNSFWVATVLKVSGYKAQLRYEGFGTNSEKDFWVNLCSSSVHPVGWCATRGKPLIPPKTIEDKYKDWKDFLVKRLTGARTLPSNFYSKVHDSLRSRFRCDLNLEVVDKNRICQIKVASIKKIVGKRLHIRYYNTDPEEDGGFWCHEDSPLIHPVGWARRIGQTIDAPPAYIDRCMKGLRDKDDASEELFPVLTSNPFAPASQCFQEGMKLEAVDPLNLSAICVATVMKVLNEGYIMIRVDSYEDIGGKDWFCYHMSSPYIFPAGFCASNSIPLSPPKAWENAQFDWAEYLKTTGTTAAPLHLFNREIPNHGFVVGMKLEAVDLMEPRLVCVATVSRVIGRLLKIHFDGWEEEYDQWLDCCSPDMYPVGWCQLVCHKLEAPPTPVKNGVNQGDENMSLVDELTASHPETAHQPPALTGLLPPAPLCAPLLPPPADCSPSPTLTHHPTSTTTTNTVQMNGWSSGSAESPMVGNREPRELVPHLWSVEEVAQFLQDSDCGAYTDRFVNKNINGAQLLNLTHDDIMDLTGMKMGPSLKIGQLITQLKIKVNPAQERMKAGLKKFL
ncbi:polycomb protein Sfmbt isoform X2 [Macrosteles quadrilineatus]|uniref:polycomb protein Sfmbt isoform X2 n=1 Tax=Macrosteles quadrilineatus TaxID=74068 RepID=UPI0023E0DD5A|nr:polycomb protein Sfmbt isoform X2 [Macrosteles quadrilineatus]